MPDLLTVGAQATQLYKTALGTVSNNIANLNSEGYSRQSVTISENAPIEIGSTFVGAGSVLTQISRAYNGFAETNLRHSSSDLNNQQPMIDYGNRIIDIFGSDTSGLKSQVKVTPKGTLGYNPAFDVTPARLVTGLITERGICDASEEGLTKLFPLSEKED